MNPLQKDRYLGAICIKNMFMPLHFNNVFLLIFLLYISPHDLKLL